MSAAPGPPAPDPETRTDYEARFARLRALRPNWDSYGARPIAEAAIVTVRHLLEAAAIVPTSKGGVQIEWHRHGADIEIEVAPSGDVESVFWAQGDAASGAARPAPPALTVERLAALLREMPIDFQSDGGHWKREAAWLLPRLGARPADGLAMLAAEHALSDAYLRLRRKLAAFGAFDTPHGPTREQIWAVTEAALDRALALAQTNT